MNAPLSSGKMLPMTLFAVSVLFSLEVQSSDAPEALRELAVHVVSARDERDARGKGEMIGRRRETTYRNPEGELVRDRFLGVIEIQPLIDDRLFDGMEVASWMFRRGERLVLHDDGRWERQAHD